LPGTSPVFFDEDLEALKTGDGIPVKTKADLMLERRALLSRQFCSVQERLVFTVPKRDALGIELLASDTLTFIENILKTDETDPLVIDLEQSENLEKVDDLVLAKKAKGVKWEMAGNKPEGALDLNVGDNVSVVDVRSTLAKTETIEGVKYELFSDASLKGKGGAVRVFDVESGNLVHLKRLPDYSKAESLFSETVEAARKATAEPVLKAQEGKAPKPKRVADIEGRMAEIEVNLSELREEGARRKLLEEWDILSEEYQKEMAQAKAGGKKRGTAGYVDFTPPEAPKIKPTKGSASVDADISKYNKEHFENRNRILHFLGNKKYGRKCHYSE